MKFDLKTFLSNNATLATDSSGQPIGQDTATVIAMVLMEIASIDGHFDNSEVNLIMRTLARALELSDDAASHTLSVADYMKRQNKSYSDYLQKLTEKTSTKQHLTLLGVIAGIIYADKKVTAGERDAILKFASELKIDNLSAEKIINEVSG